VFFAVPRRREAAGSPSIEQKRKKTNKQIFS
jgi:hypothetical protein